MLIFLLNKSCRGRTKLNSQTLTFNFKITINLLGFNLLLLQGYQIGQQGFFIAQSQSLPKVAQVVVLKLVNRMRLSVYV